MSGEILTITDILIKTYGNQSEASRMLNVNRSTLRKAIDKPTLYLVIKTGEVYSLYSRLGG